ncbi:MAG: dockerin type I repeat-containing protein [candidate division Zixibacteria bacterium]|nr:dockerin type I repeat-containing protein [candidate division Zixibacteria bacterium]MBU1469361.1 dockerin type I repeat-containing protein [candidate division Zixibacteria bacterium]MBU2623970.1 dockerin type I repeat-containing protein [candidate division Zixibacteria bacterium]
MVHKGTSICIAAALTMLWGLLADEGLSKSKALSLQKLADSSEVIKGGYVKEYSSSFSVPEYELLGTFCWSIAVWNHTRTGTGYLSEEGNLYWYDIGESMLFDQSLVISYANDPSTTWFSMYDGSDSEVSLIPMSVLAVTHTPTYTQASCQWATPDTVVVGGIEYYIPMHPDTCVMVQRIEVCNNADTTVRIHLGEGIDWDIPDGAGGVNNRSGADPWRNEVYQFGPIGSPTENYSCGAGFGPWEIKAAADVDYIAGAAVLENDNWVDPNNGYTPAEIGTFMATHAGFVAGDPDSIENLSSFYIIAQDVELEPGECTVTCMVLASRLDGLYELQELIDKGGHWTFANGIECGASGQWCVPGDADGSGFVDIDDVVYLIAYIFSGGWPPVPITCCADADASNTVDIDDVVYLIAYIFSSGFEPVINCDPPW